MPFIGNVRAFAPQLISVLLSELQSTIPELIHRSPQRRSCSIIFKGITVAQGEGVVEPDTMADDFAGESVTGVHGQAVAN